MDLQGITVTGSLVVSIVTLALLVVQTRSLSAQTRAVAKSLEYGAYLKLVDYLNDVNLELMNNPELKRVFINMDVLNQHLATVPDLSIEQVALAWHMINRYEAAYVGYRHGIVPASEWTVWQRRLEGDLRLPFIRAVWSYDISNFAYSQGFVDLVIAAIGRVDAMRLHPETSEVSFSGQGTGGAAGDEDG
jgi:hypothetical protein